MELGFALPPLDTMQNYARLKFLYDCIVRFALRTGVALELGCYKCTSTVFIAHACARVSIPHVYAIDLFTGTPSWQQSIDYEDEARAKLDRYGLSRAVTLARANTQEYAWHDPVAVLHIDADHAREAVAADIAKYTPSIVPDGIVVFDDYNVSHPGVTKAVHEWLAQTDCFEVVATNYQGREFGSTCIRRTRG
jgi:predicted O-methyltransferase YrrM